MKKYFTVSITIHGIEAKNELEAKKLFWEEVDNNDYPVDPKVEEEVDDTSDLE